MLNVASETLGTSKLWWFPPWIPWTTVAICGWCMAKFEASIWRIEHERWLPGLCFLSRVSPVVLWFLNHLVIIPYGTQTWPAGWWFGTFLFSHILGIIPIDCHIFQRGGPTTNQPEDLIQKQIKTNFFPVQCWASGWWKSWFFLLTKCDTTEPSMVAWPLIWSRRSLQ